MYLLDFIAYSIKNFTFILQKNYMTFFVLGRGIKIIYVGKEIVVFWKDDWRQVNLNKLKVIEEVANIKVKINKYCLEISYR